MIWFVAVQVAPATVLLPPPIAVEFEYEPTEVYAPNDEDEATPTALISVLEPIIVLNDPVVLAIEDKFKCPTKVFSLEFPEQLYPAEYPIAVFFDPENCGVDAFPRLKLPKAQFNVPVVKNFSEQFPKASLLAPVESLNASLPEAEQEAVVASAANAPLPKQVLEVIVEFPFPALTPFI